MRYSDILRNEHFNNIAAIVRVPLRSVAWKQEHVHVLFWTLLEHVNEVAKEDVFKEDNGCSALMAFTDLLVTLTQADDRLRYTEDDLGWLVSVFDQPEAHAIFAMLLAWVSAPDDMLTPAEIAKQTTTAESGWRNKAAAGDLPGAVKRGKQWLIPVSVLRSRGLDVRANNADTIESE